MDPNIVRVVFVVLTFLWGFGAAVYVAMWVLIPRATSGGDEIDRRDQLPIASSRWVRYSLLAGVVILALILITALGGRPRVSGGLVGLWIIFLIVIAFLTARAPARRLTLGRLVAVFFLIAVSVVIVIAGAFLALVQSTGVPLAGGTGVRGWQPTSVTEAQHVYRTAIGQSTVDLSGALFTAIGFTVTATVAVGVLVIVLPTNAVVNLKTHVGVGSVTYPLTNGSTTSAFRPFPAALTTVANRVKAPHVTVVADVGIGLVQIERAPSVIVP